MCRKWYGFLQGGLVHIQCHLMLIRHQIVCLVRKVKGILKHSLEGAAMAIEPRSQRAFFEMSATVMNYLLRFLEVYKNQVPTTCDLVLFTC